MQNSNQKGGAFLLVKKAGNRYNSHKARAAESRPGGGSPQYPYMAVEEKTDMEKYKKTGQECAMGQGKTGQGDCRKTVQDSQTEQVYIIRSQHINPEGRLFGGYLMQWIDEMAGIVSRRHSGKSVTTASIDNLNFKAGAYQNDMIVLVGRLTYVGRTSMEVRVDTYVEDYNGIRRSINRAYLVMVAMDENGNPDKVPGLMLRTEAERAEWAAGEKRYRLRKQRRAEGF